MKKSLLLLFVLFLILLVGKAQSQTGSIDLNDDEGYMRFSLVDQSKEKGLLRPSAVSLKMYCPSPGNQFNYPTCVGWAVGYAAMTTYRAVDEKMVDRTQINASAFSPGYVFKRSVEDCEKAKGAKLSNAVRLLIEEGVCTYESFNHRNPCPFPIDSPLIQQAQVVKLTPSDVSIVFDTNASRHSRISSTLIELVKNNPVLVAFAAVPPKNDNRPNLERLWQPREATNPGHAMLVVGYDKETQLFELMNSYGKYWGNGGFCFMSFDDYGQYARYAYVLRNKDQDRGEDQVNPKVYSSLLGKIGLKHISPYGIKAVKSRFHKPTAKYLSPKTSWTTYQDQFQLDIEVPQDRCVYALSLSSNEPLGQIEYAPRDTLLTITGSLSEAREENLLAIYSYSVIPDIKNRLAQLHQTKGILKERLATCFDHLLIADDEVRFYSSNIGFETSYGPKNGTIVPVIIVLKGVR